MGLILLGPYCNREKLCKRNGVGNMFVVLWSNIDGIVLLVKSPADETPNCDARTEDETPVFVHGEH